MKSYTIVLEPEARDDINEAIEYYNEIYGNLSLKFLTSLEVTIDRIKQNPFYQIKYDDVRILPLKKFPYSIHYHINEDFDEIKILAVIHTASDPDKIWMWREDE